MLPLNHMLLLLLVAFIWGTNFVLMRWALDEFPSFFFAFLRYFFTLMPFAFFIKKPEVPLKYLVVGGITAGGQFAFIFTALNSGMTPGVASLIIQSQVFMTIFMSFLVFKERLTLKTAVGISLAACGLGVIFLNLEKNITILGGILMLCAALSWSMSNITIKYAKNHAPKLDMLSFTVWSSLYAMIMLLALSLVFEGTDRVITSVIHASPLAWGAAFWQSLGNVVFGFGVWNFMLTRHPASRVAPFALLVPIFGMASSALILGEAFPLWKGLAGLLVMFGLAVTLFNFSLFRNKV
jgi:O-acetylserine/cysteine efflux transporter